MKVAQITTVDINNGPGFRCTVWVSGCNRKCHGCQNTELWNYDFGKPILSNDVIDKINCELSKDYVDGITISGGDPLDQSKDSLMSLKAFVDYIKLNYPEKSIWIYSGGFWPNLIENPIIVKILKKCDVLVDGMYIQELRDITLPFRGSKNQHIIDLQRSDFTDPEGGSVLIPDEIFKN